MDGETQIALPAVSAQDRISEVERKGSSQPHLPVLKQAVGDAEGARKTDLRKQRPGAQDVRDEYGGPQ